MKASATNIQTFDGGGPERGHICQTSFLSYKFLREFPIQKNFQVKALDENSHLVPYLGQLDKKWLRDISPHRFLSNMSSLLYSFHSTFDHFKNSQPQGMNHDNYTNIYL